MSETATAPTYSQDDIDTAEIIYELVRKAKKVAVSKKALPFEVEGMIQLVKLLQTIPIPQLKIICLVIGLLIALILVSMYVYKSI